MSKKVQAWLKEKDINNYTTKSDVKAPNVERVIRTIRMAAARFFRQTTTERWLHFLPEFVSNYNNRPHSTTKFRPLDLATDPLLVVPNPYSIETGKTKQKIPPIGSFVRIDRNRVNFEKESRGTWSDEVYKVRKHDTSGPVTLIYLEDLTGVHIEGAFYAKGLQVITWTGEKKPKYYYETRTRNKKKEILVTFYGYPKKYSEWVPLESVQ